MIELEWRAGLDDAARSRRCGRWPPPRPRSTGSPRWASTCSCTWAAAAPRRRTCWPTHGPTLTGVAHLDLDGDGRRLGRAGRAPGAPPGRPRHRAGPRAAGQQPAGGTLRLWAHGEHPGAAAIAARLGLRKVRELRQLRLTMTEPPPVPPLPDGVRIRAFRVGVDEPEFLRVNNAAFDWHPEQGGWAPAEITEREREPWFDPDGFLLAVDPADRLLGYHWTKVHPATGSTGPMGEVYVLGVDPAARGLHLGRTLTAGRAAPPVRARPAHRAALRGGGQRGRRSGSTRPSASPAGTPTSCTRADCRSPAGHRHADSPGVSSHVTARPRTSRAACDHVTRRICSSSIHPDAGVRPSGLPSVRNVRPPRAVSPTGETDVRRLQVKTVRHSARARVAAVGLTTAGALLLAGCGAANESAPRRAVAAAGARAPPRPSAGTIAGAGASSQQAAQEAWIAGFTGANPDANITYDPSGSGAGRTQFLGGGVAFAGSDAALKDEELTQGKTRCNGDVVEVPAYVSPIAVIYNLPGVTELNLAPATIAQIFDRKITKWNDPAIAADNPGATLPDLAITPVNRSDKSGTTQNFADYLKAAAPDAWSYDVSDTWPVQGGEAAQGTSGVVGAVKAGQGAIGYADESQAKDLGQARSRWATAYVGPTPEAAAAVLEASTRVEGQGDSVFAYKLARDTTAVRHLPGGAGVLPDRLREVPGRRHRGPGQVAT